MSLLREVVNGVADSSATIPDGWNIGTLPNVGIIISCDGFSAKINIEQLNLLFDIAEDGKPGEIQDTQGNVIYIEPDGKTLTLTRYRDKIYPNGVVLDSKTLKKLGIHRHEDDESESDENSDDDSDTIKEGIKTAFRKSGKKIKRGFRVTSGFRKGRVVTSARAASKPRVKASTRAKMRLGRKKKKIIRILKSKQTRRKSLSKRLSKMNSLRK